MDTGKLARLVFLLLCGAGGAIGGYLWVGTLGEGRLQAQRISLTEQELAALAVRHEELRRELIMVEERLSGASKAPEPLDVEGDGE